MKKSKSYRGAPGWQEMNTNRGAESNRSDGTAVNPEGTHMSGSSGGNTRMNKSGPKTRSGYAPIKNQPPHGQS